MAVVTLRAPLRDRAGGGATHDLPGATVGEVLRELERRHPKVTGWILDEQGRVRPHVNVFVNGERTKEDTAVAPDDVLQVLPSISGGEA
jgi:sulfur-carrier protein